MSYHTTTRKNVVITGLTDFASLMKLYLEQTTAHQVLAFTAEKQYISNNLFDGLPVVALENLNQAFPNGDFCVLNAIGYRKMNRLRARIHRLLQDQGRALLTYVHPSATVNSPLGEGCIVLENSSIGFRNNIGCGGLFWGGVIIAHNVNIGDFTYWSPGAVCCGNVTVGDRCFIGANATLRNRINLAEGTLVGAGVYMSRSVDGLGQAFRAPYSQKLSCSADEIL
jgi:sugar O-acyltransferase (sialic acid O-acetyltransferase NeuD family)